MGCELGTARDVASTQRVPDRLTRRDTPDHMNGLPRAIALQHETARPPWIIRVIFNQYGLRQSLDDIRRKSSSRLASKVPPHAGTAEPAAPPFTQAAEGMRRVARILPATEDRHRARP